LKLVVRVVPGTFAGMVGVGTGTATGVFAVEAAVATPGAEVAEVTVTVEGAQEAVCTIVTGSYV